MAAHAQDNDFWVEVRDLLFQAGYGPGPIRVFVDRWQAAKADPLTEKDREEILSDANRMIAEDDDSFPDDDDDDLLDDDDDLLDDDEDDDDESDDDEDDG